MTNKLKFKVKEFFIDKILKHIKGFNINYSQTGEDLIINSVFKNKNNGIYVDIGAFHPHVISNTNLFHTKFNWKGINIDPNPFTIEKFNLYRPNDINLQLAIANEKGQIEIYYLDETNSMNSSNIDFLKRRKVDIDKLRKEKVDCDKLENIFDKYIKDKQIDLLSIDVEGLEIEVLKSNNWNKYKPNLIVLECESFDIDDLKENESCKFLIEKKYIIISYTYLEYNLKNVFLISDEFKSTINF